MKTQDELIRWSDNRRDIPLFHDPQLYDHLFRREEWQVLTEGTVSDLSAFMIVFKKRKMGIPYITMPPLLKYGGPWFRSSLSRDQKSTILKKFLNQLRQPLIHQDWNPASYLSAEQHIPKLQAYYTYQIDLESNLETLWSSLADDYRKRKIPKAQRLGIQAQLTDDFETLWRINKMTFDRIGMDVPYTRDYVHKLHDYLQIKKRSQVFVATDGEQAYSVLYLVRDHQCAYLLMAGDHPVLRASGSGILLTWEAIKYAKEVLRVNTFDFLGSMIPGVEKVRQQFGAQKAFYPHIERVHPILKMGKRLLGM